MREQLAALVSAGRADTNLAREFLQARILASLQRCGAMVPLAFHGGTALRFLYSLPRFSEDLDFTLGGPPATYQPQRITRALTADLGAEGYQVDVQPRLGRVVHSYLIRFHGLLRSVGLPGQRDQILRVKIEVDTRPPAGAVLATTVVRRHALLQLQHHDQASLLAGKVHALLSRPYLKGRDVFDLVWYLADPGWPEPNLTLLHHALVQTGWPGQAVSATNWTGLVTARLADGDDRIVRRDVEPFLAPGVDPALVARKNVLRLLRARPRTR